ncbi:putative N-acetyl-gamma-glutamyl-phosphate reductase, chloroplastic [Tetrabaena socialis]|uniref:Probable N-acetyl-gamma-glutamyl-phosphate reductase, chloroplastic n=1 Tax=Tetrabaena socialis TaxID=47790 RepID=A0A2J8A0F1_9CHLO|nr:putative N-acetyl-gamma-glutamyl-phosphate reductase, chloroplastic [Tetrabaena socialis]|eukprot:PNH05958.1 putative N-acetyl-gamma-glutamyl-phosphate reductase, chloroplastic [Tetrabaena socialis]
MQLSQRPSARAGVSRRAGVTVRAQAIASPVSATSPSGSKNSLANIAVLGASGYTGAEVVRLCSGHPGVKVTALTGDKQAGKSFSDVFPHLVTATNTPKLVKIDDVNFGEVDAVFCCLPHATTQEVIKKLPSTLKVVDLSADFRLRDPASYGHEHAALELQKEAVYGLTEIYRDEVRKARLLANPGCYPTCSQLPLYPLMKSKLILAEDIIIDAKSGVSGAGRAAKEANLYCEIAEGINSYAVGAHRHMPEIEQGLTEAAGHPVHISFTPHLINMSRGMQCTMYVKMAHGVTADDLRAHLAATYEGEHFVRVLPKGVMPHTRHVRGSNFCLMNVFPDRLTGRAVIISVIDNLVKGASGQGLQNLNLMMGWEETTALTQLAMFP